MKIVKIVLVLCLFLHNMYIEGAWKCALVNDKFGKILFDKKNIKMSPEKMSPEYEKYITEAYYPHTEYNWDYAYSRRAFPREIIRNAWQLIKYLREYFISRMFVSPIYYQWPNEIKENILLHCISNSFCDLVGLEILKNILTQGFDIEKNNFGCVCCLNDPSKIINNMYDIKKNYLLQCSSNAIFCDIFTEIGVDTKMNSNDENVVLYEKSRRSYFCIKNNKPLYIKSGFNLLHYHDDSFIANYPITLVLDKNKLQKYAYFDDIGLDDPGEVRIHKNNIIGENLKSHIPLHDAIVGFVLNFRGYRKKDLAEIYNVIIDIPHYKEKIEKGEIKFYSIYGKELDGKVLDEIKNIAVELKKNEKK